MISKVLLTERQTSETTGFTVRTLRKRRHKELPPHYTKVGRKIFYDKNDIECYLDSGLCYLTPNQPHIKEKCF
jgi:hypothetical protein